MSVFSERLRELRGSQSQSKMADPLCIKYQHWAKYERGEVSPSVDMLEKICRVHACSADWLLGLPDRGAGGSATAHGAHAIAAAGNARITTGGDCSKCKLMKAHIREITGRP